MSSFLSGLRRQMDDDDVAEITAVIQMDDTELLAAIGRIIVEAAVLEYTVAELVAVSEGLRDEACEGRAVAIVRKPGQAMRLFERLAEQRPGLAWLVNDTKSMLAARHFVAHAVAQQDAIAEGRLPCSSFPRGTAKP